MSNAKKVLKKVNFFNDSYQALKLSSALLIATEWPEFKKLDFKKLGRLMK